MTYRAYVHFRRESAVLERFPSTLFAAPDLSGLERSEPRELSYPKLPIEAKALTPASTANQLPNNVVKLTRPLPKKNPPHPWKVCLSLERPGGDVKSLWRYRIH